MSSGHRTIEKTELKTSVNLIHLMLLMSPSNVLIFSNDGLYCSDIWFTIDSLLSILFSIILLCSLLT
jgi:hypothetical protein